MANNKIKGTYTSILYAALYKIWFFLALYDYVFSMNRKNGCMHGNIWGDIFCLIHCFNKCYIQNTTIHSEFWVDIYIVIYILKLQSVIILRFLLKCHFRINFGSHSRFVLLSFIPLYVYRKNLDFDLFILSYSKVWTMY